MAPAEPLTQADLARQFEECTLPREQWTHAAHLRVAVWFLARLPREIATARIRQGIQRYNASLGNAQGYHEMVTLVADFLSRKSGDWPLDHLADKAIEQFGGQDYLLRYFTRERLYSETAKREFVEPDRAPFPEPLRRQLLAHQGLLMKGMSLSTSLPEVTL